MLDSFTWCDSIWAMDNKEPLLETLMREKGYWEDPEYWAERIDIELGEMLVEYGDRGLMQEVLNEAMRLLSARND